MENENSSVAASSEVQNDVDSIMAGDAVSSQADSSTDSVQIDADSHPFLTTSFEDYTVTEGLLLFIFLALVVTGVVKLVKGVF